MNYAVFTRERHELLNRKPPHPIVAAVRRDWPDVLKSAWRRSTSSFERWLSKEEGSPWIVFGKTDIRDADQNAWFEHVNFELRFNHLQEDWQAFCDAVGIKADLPHLNKGPK